MKKISVELSEKQAERLLEQLPVSVKIYLLRRWEKQTWPARLGQLLSKIDSHVRGNPRLAQKALKVVGPARQDYYARRNRHQRLP